MSTQKHGYIINDLSLTHNYTFQRELSESLFHLLTRIFQEIKLIAAE